MAMRQPWQEYRHERLLRHLHGTDQKSGSRFAAQVSAMVGRTMKTSLLIAMTDLAGVESPSQYLRVVPIESERRSTFERSVGRVGTGAMRSTSKKKRTTTISGP